MENDLPLKSTHYIINSRVVRFDNNNNRKYQWNTLDIVETWAAMVADIIGLKMGQN